MNGFGLFIAVAALGVDVGWEAGPDGQSYYTIHIEKLLLGPLREGQAIVSNVDTNDRNLSRFQIIVGEHAHAISSQAGPSGKDMVQHGWRPGENGGTDYLIQISPERLESLARGSTIIGQIDPQVTDIRKLYVFSGMQQLPQQLPPSSGPPQPPKFLDAGGGLRTASAETPKRSDLPTRDRATQLNGIQFNGAQFNGTRINPVQSTGAGRAGDFHAGPVGTVTDGSPPSASGQSQQDNWRTSVQSNTAWPSEAAAASSGTGGQYGTADRMLPVPQLSGAPQTGYGRGVSQEPQAYTSPVQTGYGQPNSAYGPTSPAYGAAATTYTPNLELLLAQAKAEGAAEARTAAATQTPPSTATVTPPAETQEAENPWLPLILTTLMLFASLGTNVFLGWLAWSFFWRFRDAVGDATRAQTTLFPTRQAA